MTLQRGDVAVITGAASGIGFALAAALSHRSLRLCLIDVEPAALEATASQFRAEGADVIAFACDVSDAEAVTRVATATLEAFGGVDLLINNAGVGGLLGPIWQSPPQDWTWVLGVNVGGVVNGVRAFTPAMLARGSGHILNVASVAGLTAPPFLGPYVASKHAVVGLSETLAAEFAAIGAPIKVSVACPGPVESRIHTADRNRPPAFQAASSAAPESLARVRAVMTEMLNRGLIPADQAADAILAGVERGDAYILTHPEMNPAVRGRLERIEALLG